MAEWQSKGLHEVVFPVFRRVVIAAGGDWVHEDVLVEAALADHTARGAIQRNADEIGWTPEGVAHNEIDWWKGAWWREVGNGLEQRGDGPREFRSTLPVVSDAARRRIEERRSRR